VVALAGRFEHDGARGLLEPGSPRTGCLFNRLRAAMSAKSKGAAKRRIELRQQLWPDDRAWSSEGEVGFFQVPKTVSLLMKLIGSKDISGKKNAADVYLELWSNDWGQGLIEVGNESDHAFAAGYEGTRAVRTWRERIRILERAGFIRVKPDGNREIGFILLVHPADVVQSLKDANRVPENWLNAYLKRQSRFRERASEESESQSKVLLMKAATKS
jgi:hypothetical protein